MGETGHLLLLMATGLFIMWLLAGKLRDATTPKPRELLRPCPYCGADRHDLDFLVAGHRAAVKCRSCGMQGPVKHGASRWHAYRTAAHAWNAMPRRPAVIDDSRCQ